MKMIRMAMMLLITSAAAASGGGTLHATDRPLLIDIHRAAGLKCAQCHHEQPPTLAPAVTTCLGCHGDQRTLANKTSGAIPDPHAPPHLAAGEVQNCNECHHVHRKSEISCSTCHRDFEFDVK